MQLLDFLTAYFDDYLLSDLETMMAAQPARPLVGHLGYPLLVTCAAGIEMLGILATPSRIKKGTPNSTQFELYWSRYMYPSGTETHVGAAVYQLARNGIVHNFAAKSPIEISNTGDPANHLKQVSVDRVRIDVAVLAQRFRESYKLEFIPVSRGLQPGKAGENSGTMQDRLDDVIDNNAASYTSAHWAALGALPPFAGLPGPVTGVTSSLAPPITAPASPAPPTGSIPTVITSTPLK